MGPAVQIDSLKVLSRMHPPIIYFGEIIKRRGVSLKRSRLVRHDKRGAEEWGRSKEAFGHFASYQSTSPGPYNKCRYAFHFIPDRPLDAETHTALFVGATEVLGEWKCDGNRQACMTTDIALQASTFRPQLGERAYDLVWIPTFDDLVERIVIAWGPRSSTRSWSQWPERQDKKVIEIRREAQEPPFPGFQAFITTLEEIPFLPRSWCEVLASVNGVYLLVHPEGKQYVGSAYGEGGFLGRWNDYVKTGDGGNQLLKQRGQADYTVSILEIVSSAMSQSDIIERENIWKEKLGSRVHGLNAN